MKMIKKELNLLKNYEKLILKNDIKNNKFYIIGQNCPKVNCDIILKYDSTIKNNFCIQVNTKDFIQKAGMLKSLDGITILENDIILFNEKINFKLEYKTSYYTINKIDGNCFEVNNNTLKKTIDNTLYSISTNPDNYTVNNVLLSYELLNTPSQTISLICTDLYRMAKYDFKVKRLDFNNNIVSKYNGKNILINPDTMDRLNKFLSLNKKILSGTTKVTFNDETIFIENDNIILYSNLINIKYPDYKTIIEDNHSFSISLNKKEIFESLKIIKELSRFDKFQRYKVIFHIKNKSIRIYYNDFEYVVKDFILKDNFNQEFDKDLDFKICLNSYFLVDYLNVCNDNIKIKFSKNNRLKIMLNSNNNDLYLVMPLVCREA